MSTHQSDPLYRLIGDPIKLNLITVDEENKLYDLTGRGHKPSHRFSSPLETACESRDHASTKRKETFGFSFSRSEGKGERPIESDTIKFKAISSVIFGLASRGVL